LGQEANIRKNQLLMQIAESFPHNGNKIALIFLKTLCDGCKSAMIVREMIAHSRNNKSEIMMVLYNSFNKNDIGNLKRHIGNIPMRIAPEELLREWKRVSIEYSELETETIVIIASNDGNTEYFYSPGYRCEGNIAEILK
jgi:hypothetical protein